MACIPEPKKILITNLAYIGDVTLSTPTARALKKKYPDAIIDMLVVPLTKGIAEGNPYVNEVLIYDKQGVHRKIGNLWKLVKTIRARQYDMSVCTNFAPRGAMLALAAKIPFRIGFDAQHATWFLTHTTPAREKVVRHASQKYLDVLASLEIFDGDTMPEYKINPDDIKTMQDKITLNFKQDFNKPIFILCPLGRHSERSWTVRGCSNLLKNIAGMADCYLIGNKAQEAELNHINESCGNLAKVLAGMLTLGELAAFIAAANLLVSVDTGPLHIAEAVKTPVVALFGVSDPNVWGPRGDKSRIFTASLDCSPCDEICESIRCMQILDEEAIIAAAIDILK